MPLPTIHDLVHLEPVRAALRTLRERDAVPRLHRRDPSLWSDDPAVRATIAQRLGWLDAAGGRPGGGPAPAQEWADAIAALAEGARADGLAHVVLAGMGGSSLAPEVFAKVSSKAQGGRVRGLSLRVLDSTHPAAVSATLDQADLDRTLVLVSSKSGSTEETRAFAAHAAALVPDPRHLVAITDAGSALDREATAAGWRAVLRNPADIGGRFSALSLFGMAPAGLLGVDLAKVWATAAAHLAACHEPDPEHNPGAQLAAFMAGFALAGRDKLTLLAPPWLAPLGDWVEQLVAESTGKDGRGVVPIVGEAPGEPSQYGEDRAFVAYRDASAAEALAAAGFPVLFLDVDGPDALGAEYVRWEVATALAGVVLGVNPFDEPNVTESKRNTAAVLEEVAAGAPVPPVEEGDVRGLVEGLRPGDYLSLQAYLPPTGPYATGLDRIRALVRDRTRVATTAGWGPRFLHSTGQLHKGGPDTAVALQLVDPVEGGPGIPGRPYDFATLLRAQAAGDLRSLRAHGRRVAQVAVRSPADLERLHDTLEGYLR